MQTTRKSLVVGITKGEEGKPTASKEGTDKASSEKNEKVLSSALKNKLLEEDKARSGRLPSLDVIVPWVWPVMRTVLAKMGRLLVSRWCQILSYRLPPAQCVFIGRNLIVTSGG